MHARTSVVAGTDFSAISTAVLRQATRCAVRLGGGCTIVHVVDVLEDAAQAAVLMPALRRRVAAERRDAQEAMAALVADLGEALVPLATRVEEGRPADRISEIVAAEKAELAVVGGPPPQRMLGAIAEKVVRISPVPVLVVRMPPPRGYRNLLAAVDFSPEAHTALEAALRLVEEGASVTLWHAVDPRAARGVDDISSAVCTLEARLREWAAETLRGREAAVEVVQGKPRKVLLDEASSRGADLLAVGCGRAGRLRQFLLGSVAEAAARGATCDVLVAGRMAARGTDP